jgi:two-component system sensor kinase FixL
LFQNAVNSVEEGNPPLPRITIATRCRADGDVTVIIQDNGKSVASNIRERIFEPFITSKQNGTGIGLFLCRTIIEKFGGKVGLDSEEGQETVFHVKLPVFKGEVS